MLHGRGVYIRISTRYMLNKHYLTGIHVRLKYVRVKFEILDFRAVKCDLFHPRETSF